MTTPDFLMHRQNPVHMRPQQDYAAKWRRVESLSRKSETEGLTLEEQAELNTCTKNFVEMGWTDKRGVLTELGKDELADRGIQPTSGRSSLDDYSEQYNFNVMQTSDEIPAMLDTYSLNPRYKDIRERGL